MKKIVSLLTALMMICSMSMTAVFAEGEEVTTPEAMTMRDTADMVSAQTSWSAWYKNGVTNSNYRWDNYAHRVILVDDELKELDDYVIEFTNELQTNGEYKFVLGGTTDEEYAFDTGKNGCKATKSVSSTDLKFAAGSVVQTVAHNLTATENYKLYISYADNTIVYGIKAADADDSTYVWNTASNVDLDGTVIAQRWGVIYDETHTGTILDKNDVLTVASMYIGKELSASVADGLYDVNPKDIAVTFGNTLAETLPEAVTVSDGKTSVECAVTRTDDTTATVTVPDGALSYGTRYAIDLSAITDADGVAAKKLYFKTVDLSTVAYEQVENVKFAGYVNGAVYEHFQYDDRDKVALLTKDGEPVTVNDFMISFDYADTSTEVNKYLNVVFGIDPSITTYKPNELAAENKFNGLAGISLWKFNSYNMYFGNTLNTYHAYATYPYNFFRDGGKTHDLVMEKGKTYNVNVVYSNKVMTLYVKTSDENIWRKYTKTMSDDYEEIQDGHIAIISKFKSAPSNIKLYEPRTITPATIAEGAYDVNPGTINVTAAYDFGTLPSAVAVSDGTNSVDCAIALSADDAKTAVITIPANTLAYGTTYTVDLSAAKDLAGVTVANASFATIANPVPADMVKMSGLSRVGYTDGNINEHFQFNDGGDSLAVLTKDGEPVRVNDFVLTFNATNNSNMSLRTLNVIFGVNPETERTAMLSWAKTNNFNGLAGISNWNNSKRYRTIFGNDAITSQSMYCYDQGTNYDLDFAKGEKYNLKVSYIDKVMTFYVKKDTENAWRVYSRTMPEDYTEIKDGLIGIGLYASTFLSDIALYTPVEDYTVSAPSYDKAIVNGEAVTVTASVTKNVDSAVYNSATLITGLYKYVDGEWVFEKAVTDTKSLTTGTAAELSKSIEIPAEGTYKLKSFVWNIDNLYSFGDAAELTVE